MKDGMREEGRGRGWREEKEWRGRGEEGRGSSRLQ